MTERYVSRSWMLMCLVLVLRALERSDITSARA
jgi:hypothetical protein